MRELNKEEVEKILKMIEDDLEKNTVNKWRIETCRNCYIYPMGGLEYKLRMNYFDYKYMPWPGIAVVREEAMYYYELIVLDTRHSDNLEDAEVAHARDDIRIEKINGEEVSHTNQNSPIKKLRDLLEKNEVKPELTEYPVHKAKERADPAPGLKILETLLSS